MKMRDIGGALVGGFAVYVAMAACTAAEHTPAGSTTASVGPGGGHGGAGGSGGLGGLAQAGSGGQSGSGQGGMAQGGNGGMDAGIWDVLTDPVPDASADPVSGSRLKAKYRSGDDGSKAYLPYLWYDSQRQEDCQFTAAADGKERCLPTLGAASAYFFSDAACTQLLASDSTGCTPKYALSYESSCPSVYLAHLYPVGAMVNPPTLYIMSGGSCVSAGSPLFGYTYFKLGAELPPASFVGSTVQNDP